jgi:hypothetical protein
MTIEGAEDYPIPLAHGPYQLLAISSTSRGTLPGFRTLNFRSHMVIHFIFWESILTKNVGDIMSFRVFGQVVVVLNSIKAAKDLLEKNADIYSDRPVIPFYEM